jgi:ElaB/YqjD/DUF883 family membrane-anchored ribosome-binding protein
MSTSAIKDAVEPVVSAVENGVASVSSTVGNQVADINSEELRSDLSDYRREIVSAVGAAVSGAQRSAKRVAHQAEDVYANVRDHAVDYTRSATRYTKQHPLTSVAVLAAVAGLATAFVLMRRR